MIKIAGIQSGFNDVVSYTGAFMKYEDDNFNYLKTITSGTLTPKAGLMVDIFLVGGGGGGSSSPTTNGGGGGGGYTQTYYDIILGKGTNYSVIVGSGGAPGKQGGTSSFADVYSASGGNGAPGQTDGGNGGSGGGTYQGNGGSDGSDGVRIAPYINGIGQRTTTRAFGESEGELYSGGGGGYAAAGGAGGGGSSNQTGAANTGGGGGRNASGGSGTVMIRWLK